MDVSKSKTNNCPPVPLPDSCSAWNDDKEPNITNNTDIYLFDGFNDNKYQENPFFVDDLNNINTLTDSDKVKIKIISESFHNKLTYGELKRLGISNLGFVTDDIRRLLWPKILKIRDIELIERNEELKMINSKIPHNIYQQILNDVSRSGSHLMPNASEAEIIKFHDELTKMICWVLVRHPNLNYYQGYNDVAATVLIVMGLKSGLYILEKISLEFLERFMEKTMEKVNQELFYIFALLERVHPTLLEHLENVELFPHFALAEYTTWYAHKYSENRKLLHRLFDFFLGSPPLMPLYVSTVIVAHRATEIFNTTPDMGHTHKVLCTLPLDLPIEDLLSNATKLYNNYPPESIGKDVYEYDRKRHKKEQEWKLKAIASRKEREKQCQLKVAVPRHRLAYHLKSYRTITVVTILAIGLYAFIKTGSGLN
ncbi:TBC1 domain family member 20 [Chelonus insularis]|uniref:TBC1 domain family member 20 n=1 Tax=Chelonus insularis TaxID=460826 RepID=UPI00158EB0A6|nr:TBC1 domain family member 20 [Chelonus insularis]